MATFTHGAFTLSLSDSLTLREEAGNLSLDEMRRMAKAQEGVGQACEDAADCLDEAGEDFVLPKGVNPQELRAAAKRMKIIDQMIAQSEHVTRVLRQTRLIESATALDLVGKVNDHAKIQGKREPKYRSIFARVMAYFQRSRQKKSDAPKPPTTPTEPAPASDLY